MLALATGTSSWRRVVRGRAEVSAHKVVGRSQRRWYWWELRWRSVG